MYTEAQCHDMRENYQLVLGREEEQVLRREIWAVTLSSWIFMVMAYLTLLQVGPNVVTSAHSDVTFRLLFAIYVSVIAAFTVFKRILSLVFWCCAPAQSSSKNRCSIRPRALLRRLCHDILFTLLSFLMIAGAVFICGFIQQTFNPRFRPMDTIKLLGLT